MVKVKSPLLSSKATGKIGKTLLYQGQRAITILRRLFRPKNPGTDLQKRSRRCVYCANFVYYNLYENERNDLDQYVKNNYNNLTAINWLVKICQLDQISKLDHI